MLFKRIITNCSICEKMIACDTCHGFFEKNYCQEKMLRGNHPDQKIFFCPRHKVKWDFKSIYPISTMRGALTGQIRISYGKENIKCNKEGELIDE